MRLLLVCILSFISAIGYGQTYIPRYTAAQVGKIVSKAANDIWVIYQDDDRHYWFGSNSQGVYYYDGHKMVHFTTSQGLCNNSILEIKQSERGDMYFNTRAGISRFDGDKFTTLTATPGEWKLGRNDLWFKGNHGPYRYDGKTLYSLKFPKHRLEDGYYKAFPNTPIDPYDIYYIYTDATGNVWFGTGAMGLYRYDGTSVSNLYEEHLTLIEGGGSFGIRSILQDSKGKYWICNTKYRYNIHPVDKQKGNISYTREKGIDHIKHPTTNDRIYYQSIAEDAKGHLWLQTYSTGVYKYDGKQLTQYLVKDGNETVNIISMYRDDEGGLWLGTESKGAYKFNGKAFVPFR